MFIASASTTVKFHEFPSGNVIYNYQPGTKIEGPLRSISWSRDGLWLALVPHSGLTEIVGVKDKLKLIKTLEDINEPSCAAFQTTTKKFLGIGTKGGQVLIYDIKSKNTKKRFPRASSFITHIDFTAKDTHCVAGCKNGDVLLYSNTSNNLSGTYKVPKSNSVSCLRANKLKRNLFIGGSNEGVVVVWDGSVNKVKFFMDSHKAPVTSVAFSPVNSDLIASTGLDRQFCFYDIVDNKCIVSVPVQNNITALDFSPDGTYFITASQNGRISLYDSRNIQEAVHSYQAHKSTIKHLSFQNTPETGNGSDCSISSEIVTPVQSSEIIEKRNSDLFGIYSPSPLGNVDNNKTSVSSLEGGDSFIAALGLDKNNTDSFRQQESNAFEPSKRLSDIREQHNTPSSQISDKIIHDQIGIGDCKSKHLSSTPNYLTSNLKSTFSPILAFNQPTISQNITVSEIQNIAKEAVKEELKSHLEDFKADIKFQGTHIIYQTRRMLLDLQMAMIREFIKVENYCNGLKEELCADVQPNNPNNYLMEENEQLKKRIEFLEQQITNMSLSQNYQNGNTSA